MTSTVTQTEELCAQDIYVALRSIVRKHKFIKHGAITPRLWKDILTLYRESRAGRTPQNDLDENEVHLHKLAEIIARLLIHLKERGASREACAALQHLLAILERPRAINGI